MYNTCRRIPETIGFTGYFLYFVVSLNHQISGEKPVPRDAKDIQFAELKDMIAQLNTTIAALTGTIQEKDAAIAKLTEEVSYLRRKLFGASSEKRPGIDPSIHLSILASIHPCMPKSICRSFNPIGINPQHPP